MSKKVIIISSTPRKNGNSQILCEAFKKGTEEAGNEAELISLRENKINYCIACYGCSKTGRCVQKDRMNEILDKIIEADVLVLATPIYMYDVCGQLKTFIDRIFPKYSEIKDKDLYFIATCAEEEKEVISGAVETINGLLECVDNVELKGVVYGTGLDKAGEALNSKAYNEAYELGKNI